jgi:Putative prokaryotic signal transducing protein
VDDLVVLEAVSTEMEADLICSVLRGEGIQSMYRPTNFATGANDGLSGSGAREILVRADDAGKAREVLELQRHSGL